KGDQAARRDGTWGRTAPTRRRDGGSGRGNRRRRGPGRDGPLAADAAAFPLGEPTPDPELLPVPQRVLEALHTHLAAATHALGLLGGGPAFREEQVGVDAETVRSVLPTFPFFSDPRQDFVHRPPPLE